jgi:hypothetical protein
MIYFCCTELRRNAVKQHPTLNGIDFLEVLDDPALPNDKRQRRLFVHFIKPLAAGALKQKNIRIEGGERIRDVAAAGDPTIDAGDKTIFNVDVNQAGDFSIYTLRLVKDVDNADPPGGFDPMLSAVDFSFKVECGTDFDCAPVRVCPPEPRLEPEIDYLAKDYNSFRQLMLDRMAAIMPQWRERNAADLGIALVELLAYLGDHLSYQQDAIGTEAYLGTARRRVSVRRHARLVDYRMHDGCNARTWVQVQVTPPNVSLPQGTQLLTLVPGQATLIAPASPEYQQALIANPEIFETLQKVTLYHNHNQLKFYTWGESECCLPKGATRATLQGSLTNLRVGDFLVFKEVLGPKTGQPQDADPSHRVAVRLTSVDAKRQDPLGGRFAHPPNNNSVDITEIAWSVDDALPFVLCISSKTDKDHGQISMPDVSIALGNIVLVDHGRSIAGESLGSVPAPRLFRAPVSTGDRCAESPPVAVPPRYRPLLKEEPLTFAAALDPAASARAAMQQSLPDALPAITLHSTSTTKSADWHPVRDLLDSAADKTDFVAEVETDGSAILRFGDNQYGLRPDAGTAFSANYRVGNGTRGNVGAEAIHHIVTVVAGIDRVCNPLPAQGGTEPESIEDVRQRAPSAFRTQKRAVTSQDYATVVERNPDVQRAAARFRWTGSWRTVFVTADRWGGAHVDEKFGNKVRGDLERYRMAGHDVDLDEPVYVSLEIEMHVCAKADYFRADVKQALLDVFNNRVRPDGQRGVFHPDKFTFSQTVYLSPLYAAAQAVEGVESVDITVFQRQGDSRSSGLKDGKIVLNRLEIARLDNDRNFPEHGVFNLIVEGGK